MKLLNTFAWSLEAESAKPSRSDFNVFKERQGADGVGAGVANCKVFIAPFHPTQGALCFAFLFLYFLIKIDISWEFIQPKPPPREPI
jgi:hypothetical protein